MRVRSKLDQEREVYKERSFAKRTRHMRTRSKLEATLFILWRSRPSLVSCLTSSARTPHSTRSRARLRRKLNFRCCASLQVAARSRARARETTRARVHLPLRAPHLAPLLTCARALLRFELICTRVRSWHALKNARIRARSSTHPRIRTRRCVRTHHTRAGTRAQSYAARSV
eukprot:1985086-Pleurochrysis_carterae.AAC.1